VEATFHRSVAFAPPGKGHGEMRAVFYLVREGGQENGVWFEAPAADFDRYSKDVQTTVAGARIRARKAPAQ